MCRGPGDREAPARTPTAYSTGRARGSSGRRIATSLSGRQGGPSGSALRGGSTGFFSIFPSSTLCSENSEPVIDGSARPGGRGFRTVRPRNPQDRTGPQMGGKTGPECDKTLSRYEGQG